MTLALYRKWRPRVWDEVIGQEHVVQTLRNAVVTERVAHAYLFAGPRGTGKTTTARLLAKAVNCLDPDPAVRPCDRCAHCQAVNAGRFLDLIEIDAASNTSVDVRDLRDKINFSPNQGRFKVYVVDEVHMLSTAAFNALLKTLEEPPPHAIFILATTEVHKIPATVLSRCQRHEFRRIPTAEMVAYLTTMVERENLLADSDALALIARQSTGSLRDAISLLDQLASTGRPIDLELAQSVLGTVTNQSVLALVDALIAKDTTIGLELIHRALDAGNDPRQFARQIVDYLRDLLLIQTGNADQVEAVIEVRAQMEKHAQSLGTADLLRVIRAFNHAGNEARTSWQPALPLEMAYIEACQAGAQVDADIVKAGPAEPKVPSARPTISASVHKTQAVEKEPASSPLDPPSSTESETAQALDSQWPQVLSLVRKKNPNTYGLLNSCRSRSLNGRVLTLGFASDVLKTQMSKKDNLDLVQKVLAEVSGIEINVHCVINTVKRTAIPDDLDHDGMVAAALRDLGGEIVDIQ
jgi:DNA polymerase-3 subunit gamma/tau